MRLRPDEREGIDACLRRHGVRVVRERDGGRWWREPEPCALHDLADLRRALGPDALSHCGTVRARYAGEAA